MRHDVLDVRDDQVARDELDQASGRRTGTAPATRPAREPWKPCRRRLSSASISAPVIRRRSGRAGRAASGRASSASISRSRGERDVELVEERRDRVVVAGQEPEALERVVDRLVDPGVARVPACVIPVTVSAIVRRCYPSRRWAAGASTSSSSSRRWSSASPCSLAEEDGGAEHAGRGRERPDGRRDRAADPRPERPPGRPRRHVAGRPALRPLRPAEEVGAPVGARLRGSLGRVDRDRRARGRPRDPAREGLRARSGSARRCGRPSRSPPRPGSSS